MNSQKLTASIVTYQNEVGNLNQLTDSLLRIKLNCRVNIVDNASCEPIKRLCQIKKINYIATRRNVGFGSGHNIVIRQIIDSSKYHLVVNPDINFKDGEIEKAYTFMENNPKVGLLMPKILNPDGSIQYLCKLLPSPLNLILRRFFYKNTLFRSLFEKINRTYELRFKDYDKIMEPPCLSGCFILIRCAALKHVGIFDERFFVYMEDFDLSRRMRSQYKTVYFPEAVVFHEHKKGSYKNIRHLKLHAVSAIKYFNKWGWVFDRERKRINSQVLQVPLNNAYAY